MDTNRDSLSSALLQSIDLLAKSAANNTNGTLTIEAKIVDVVDEGKGIYKVEYLGNTFEAATASSEVIYSLDDMVYVLVPDGNFDKNKVILSPASPAETTYASTENGVSYITFGDNLFASIADVELCTYRPETKIVSTDKTGFAQLFAEALKDSRVFNFTSRIKTNIDKSRRTKGNYGLNLVIPVIQENESTEYTVTLDINNIKGDPYNFTEFALQNLYFELPADMTYDTSRQPSISAFVDRFIGDYSASAPVDIWIKDIQLLSTVAAVGDSTSGYYLVLTATEGTSYLASRTSDTKTLNPTLYLNNKVTKLTDFDCYWFRENCLVDNESDKFSRFGGLGWEILNEKTGVEVQEGGKETFQYVTNIYQLTVKQDDIHSATRYKCVLVKGDKVVNQTITLRNLASNVKITLESKTGFNIYTENVGRARLVVTYYESGVTDVDVPTTSVGYAWQRYDKFGSYIDNDFYVIERLNEKVDDHFETEISYPVSEIDEFNTLYCTVYTEVSGVNNVKQVIAGTRSVILSTSSAAAYNIKVENGDKLYKYDADGDSPKVADYDGPLSSAIKEIMPINITLYKPEGDEFTADEYAVTTVEWLVPVNSMIKLTATQKQDTTSNPGYYTIKGSYNNYKSLNYDIVSSYNKNKLDNTIIIRAFLKGNSAENVANLRFLKDGESGTNGSKYSAIVTYNGMGYGEKDTNGKQNKLQLVFAVDKIQWYYWNPSTSVYAPITPGATFATLGVDTYADGEKITNSTIEWSLFDSSYTYDNIRCPFTVASNGGLKLKAATESYAQWADASQNFCATVQAKVRAKRISADDGQTASEEYVYAYYPIEMTRVEKYENLNGFYPSLVGGFSQVVYASDGTNPQYDNSNNFEVAGDVDGLYNYTWSSSANISVRKLDDQSCKATPATKYDNGAAKNFIKISGGPSSSASSTLANLISQTQSKVTNETNRLSYYNTLQDALSIFNGYDYDSYVSDLQTASTFFTIKTNYIKNVKEFKSALESRLEKVEVFYKTDQSTRMIRLRNEIIDRIGKFTNLLNLAYKMGSDLTAVTQIQSVAPAQLLLTPFNYESGDPNYYMTFHDAVEKYNTEIRVLYTSYYNQLDNTFITLQSLVKYEIDELTNYVNDSKWITLSSPRYGISEQVYLYAGLVKNLKAYVASISNEENYSYDKIITNVLKPIQTIIKQYSNINYDGIIAKINDKITELTTELNRYKSIKLPSNNGIIHIKPIVMLFNRYEMANINGWDGNKTTVEDGYILTPQMGAGKKENGLFTGVVMGVKQTGVKSTTNQRIGLFGYYQGKQSLFLNSKDGSAIFGLSGKGQIVIDPQAEKGMIYSSNYWKNYNASDGKPSSYGSGNLNGAGMLIDLTTPEIKFGSGNFSVTSDGYLTAKGGGSIAGWKISDTQLYSDITAANGRITLESSGTGKIYSHSHSSLDATGNGFYLSKDGMSIGSKVYIDAAGAMRLGYGATSGTGRHWVISGTSSNSYICYGTNTWHEADTDGGSTRDVYLGTDGFSLGRRFSVSNLGELKAYQGQIGGWTISRTKLSAGNIELDASGQISGGDSSNRWYIYPAGVAYFSNVIANQKGNIAGWNINPTTLTGGNITLNSEGSMTGPTWSITAGGVATFNNVVLKGNTASTSGQASSMDWGDNFSVDTAGNLRCKNAYVEGEIQANKGKIGGINITTNKIYGSNWELNSTGGEIGGWNITSTGLSTVGTSGNPISISKSNNGFLNIGDIIASDISGTVIQADAALYAIHPNDDNYYDVAQEIYNLWEKVNSKSDKSWVEETFARHGSYPFSGSASVSTSTGSGTCSGNISI